MADILVVVDMQKDFVYGVLGTSEARAIVPNVVKKIEEYMDAGKTVVFTLDSHNTEYDNTNEGKHLPFCHCVEDTYGWYLIDEVENLYRKLFMKRCTPTFRKHTFGSIDLGQWVEEESRYRAVESIEVIGVCTDICVISNILLMKTFAPELEYYVDAKCCAGSVPAGHDAAIKVMKSCHINII